MSLHVYGLEACLIKLGNTTMASRAEGAHTDRFQECGPGIGSGRPSYKAEEEGNPNQHHGHDHGSGWSVFLKRKKKKATPTTTITRTMVMVEVGPS